MSETTTPKKPRAKRKTKTQERNEELLAILADLKTEGGTKALTDDMPFTDDTPENHYRKMDEWMRLIRRPTTNRARK